jgi:4'-phosphopantetheinyl transferase
MISSPGPADVHVWWIDLESIPEDARRVLALDERARAARFRDPRDASRWTAARSALRQVLAAYSGTAPETLQLRCGSRGKPDLADPSPLRFSLAHAGGRAALAVAWEREVGVDLEPLAPALELTPLLAIACTQSEAAHIKTLPPADQPLAFLQLWAVKEAYLKAIGTGLSRDPRAIEVVMKHGQPALHDPLAERAGAGLSTRLLDAGSGWVAALAIAGAQPNVSQFHWPMEPAP